jgi:hypothetical protein
MRTGILLGHWRGEVFLSNDNGSGEVERAKSPRSRRYQICFHHDIRTWTRDQSYHDQNYLLVNLVTRAILTV